MEHPSAQPSPASSVGGVSLAGAHAPGAPAPSPAVDAVVVGSRALLPPDQPALVDRHGAAAILGMPTSTLRLRIVDGKVPPAVFNSGRTVLWSAAELHAWVIYGCPSAVDWARTWKTIRRRLFEA